MLQTRSSKTHEGTKEYWCDLKFKKTPLGSLYPKERIVNVRMWEIVTHWIKHQHVLTSKAKVKEEWDISVVWSWEAKFDTTQNIWHCIHKTLCLPIKAYYETGSISKQWVADKLLSEFHWCGSTRCGSVEERVDDQELSPFLFWFWT